jgi:2-polyprenyl-3-methyl-5-hydroxy-6-metoxy-1,4-benzoquinol methylase
VSSQSRARYYEEYWGKGIAGWTPKGVTASPMEQALVSRFVRAGSRVLDFGCGDGSHLGDLAISMQASYLGMDVSQAAVELCKKKGLNAVHREPDAPFPLEENTFDCVVSFEVFEHVADLELPLLEILRVLTPGGFLVGSVPNSVHLSNRLLMAVGYFSPGGSPETSLKAPWKDPHIRFFNKKSLLAFLGVMGFRERRVIGSSFSLVELPIIHRSRGAVREAIRWASVPVGFLGRLYPNLFSPRLYFIAKK